MTMKIILETIEGAKNYQNNPLKTIYKTQWKRIKYYLLNKCQSKHILRINDLKTKATLQIKQMSVVMNCFIRISHLL